MTDPASSHDADRVVTVEPFDDAGATLVVDGDLDLATASQLATALHDQIGHGHRHLVVDLSHATFFDSCAMVALLRGLAPLRDEPAAAVALINGHPVVRRALEVSGIGEMFSSFETRDQAITAISNDPERLCASWRQVGRGATPGS